MELVGDGIGDKRLHGEGWNSGGEVNDCFWPCGAPRTTREGMISEARADWERRYGPWPWEPFEEWGASPPPPKLEDVL